MDLRINKFLQKRTGYATLSNYMRGISQLEKKGSIKKPDISKIKIVPTDEELHAYKTAMINWVKNEGLTKVDVNIIQISAALMSHKYPTGTSTDIFGLIPGSFDPLHYGHINTAPASILEMNLRKIKMNGVLFATGGKAPDKPENAAHHHREAMASLTLKEFHPWMTSTSIRNIIAEGLGDIYLDNYNKKFNIMGDDPEERRTFCDIAAFSWLFAMNPDMGWYYIIGSDKFENYATKPMEKDLIHDAFFMNKNVDGTIYFDRKDRPVNIKQIKSCAWLKEIWNANFFIKSRIPSYNGLSLTDIRKNLWIIDVMQKKKTGLDINMLFDGNILQITEGIKSFTTLGRTLNNVASNLHPEGIKYIFNNGLIDLYMLNEAVHKGEISRDSDEYREKIEVFHKNKIID